ncbi:MAG TPA: hypothetical protein VMD59_04935 [Acidimicrobiales bacterium]|nr:hypothetical protein [Acidimicrobiales bacterium]
MSARRRRRRAGPLALALLTMTALACGAQSRSPATAIVRPWLAAEAFRGLAAPSGCTLPLVHETFQGYHVGVPSGWDVDSLGGTVEVEQNATGTVAALLYPALQTKGLTAAAFFTSYLRFEQRRAASEGGSFSFTMQRAPGGAPRASISLHSGGAVYDGEATVLQVPLRTQLGSGELVFFAYWAPPAHLEADAGTLAAIGRCYGAEPATLFRVVQIGSFTYIEPSGWTPSIETQDALDLRGYGGDAYVSYLLFGIPPSASTPQDALSYIFGRVGLRLTGVLSTDSLPERDVDGGVQGQEYEEFLALDGGKSFHGLVYVLTDSASAGTFGVLRLGMATPALWNGINGGLVEMMGSVQHNYSGDLENIERLDQQWQAFSGGEADFDDIINGQQLVQDPSSGAYYEAPYSSYDPEGPDGGGYYLNGQLLNPVSRS